MEARNDIGGNSDLYLKHDPIEVELKERREQEKIGLPKREWYQDDLGEAGKTGYELALKDIKELGYRKPAELLSPEERDSIRKEWLSSQPQLYDDLIDRSAKAQLDKGGE